jgi:hypothetical protein
MAVFSARRFGRFAARSRRGWVAIPDIGVLIHEPRRLLADAPAGNLDPATARRSSMRCGRARATPCRLEYSLALGAAP